jgi:phytoene dehydrogenase-like protein
VEANAELGSFCCTHETWPQTLDSPHVGVSFAGNSPVIADLELERYGFRFAASPVLLATTYRDGTNCLICQDPERTAENFARHSARDGQRMLEIQSRVDETMVEFNELCSFSPHPGSRQAATGLRAVRLRHGLPGRADDGDDRARAV